MLPRSTGDARPAAMAGKGPQDRGIAAPLTVTAFTGLLQVPRRTAVRPLSAQRIILAARCALVWRTCKRQLCPASLPAIACFAAPFLEERLWRIAAMQHPRKLSGGYDYATSAATDRRQSATIAPQGRDRHLIRTRHALVPV